MSSNQQPGPSNSLLAEEFVSAAHIELPRYLVACQAAEFRVFLSWEGTKGERERGLEREGTKAIQSSPRSSTIPSHEVPDSISILLSTSTPASMFSEMDTYIYTDPKSLEPPCTCPTLRPATIAPSFCDQFAPRNRPLSTSTTIKLAALSVHTTFFGLPSAIEAGATPPPTAINL